MTIEDLRRSIYEEAIDEAIDEAERFIEKAKLVLEKNTKHPITGGKYTGAVKRSSMDLSRALSRLRKNICDLYREEHNE